MGMNNMGGGMNNMGGGMGMNNMVGGMGLGVGGMKGNSFGGGMGGTLTGGMGENMGRGMGGDYGNYGGMQAGRADPNGAIVSTDGYNGYSTGPGNYSMGGMDGETRGLTNRGGYGWRRHWQRWDGWRPSERI